MKPTAPISFAGSQLAETRHVCAFFNSEEEEYRVLLPFIKGGFECGHKAVHVVNPDQRSDHMKRLVDAGIDPAEAERSGQLELRINTDTYLRDCRFDKDRMLSAFEQIASGNVPEHLMLAVSFVGWTGPRNVTPISTTSSSLNRASITSGNSTKTR
jgi:MEDS: MEthanogen/methylotroph, DcmR Sensory domain